ncbi:hypothetical protein BDA99DRAFT_520896 [Phascolomyces articulosus]|uniref:F-box domain-containing protein n=1 Tax=Phascolomyces articulosus TaxID=60185 RepID=A0AAD5PAI9_9FUNG|nr:hypothetical protein BDA99DRAFT_520896 [Phascolomyces articulosus]
MKLRDLPPEILSLTLQTLQQPDLYQCIFVNQRFNAAAIQHLWRTPVVHNHQRFKLFIKCLRSSKKPVGSWIRHFRIAWGGGVGGTHEHQQQQDYFFDDDDCLLLLPHVPQLEEFAVQNSDRLTDKSICMIPAYCQQLEILYLKRANITYRSAHHLGRGCKQLRKLTFDHCLKLQPMALLPFADCPLEYLDLSGCKWINVEDTAYDIRMFKRLRHLDIICSDKTTMMNEFLLALASKRPLSSSSSPSDNNAYTYHNHHHYYYRHHHSTMNTNDMLMVHNSEDLVVVPELESFSMTGCSEIGDMAAIQFIETHPYLGYLTLMACGITDATLDAIQRHLPQLVYLDISFCQSVSMGGVRRLIRGSKLQMIGLKACGLRKFQFPEVPWSRSELFRQTQVDIFNETEIDLIRTYPDPLPESLFFQLSEEEIRAQQQEQEQQQNDNNDEQNEHEQMMQIDPMGMEDTNEEQVAAVYALIHQSLEANLL